MNNSASENRPTSPVDRQALFLLSAVGSYLSRPDTGEILQVNPRLCAMLGREELDLVGEVITSIIHPDDRLAETEEMNRLASGRCSELRVKRRYLRADDSVMWGDLSCVLCPGEPSEPAYIAAAIWDITDCYETETLQAAMAQENAVMNQLHAVAMSAAGDLTELFEEIVDAAMVITGAAMGQLQLFDPHKGGLTIAAQRGFDAPYIEHFAFTRPERACISGVALSQARRLVVEDIEQMPSIFERSDLSAMREAGVRAAQATPLVTRSGAIVGMLSTHYREPRKPSEQYLPALDLLARLSADLLVKRRLMDELRDAEHRNRLFLGAVADPVIMVNEVGRIAYANPIADKVFGYPEGGLVGQPHTILIPDHLQRIHEQHTQRFLQQPVARPMGQERSLLGRRRDGSEFPIEVSLNPLETSDGVMISTVVRDISERLRLEAAAQIEAARLASAIESIPDIVGIWDQDDRLVACNSAFRHLLQDSVSGAVRGLTATAIAARAERLFRSSEDARALFFGERAAQSGTTDIHLRDARLLRATTREMQGGGRVTVASDLTDDQRRQQELEAARASAEAASRAKSEFLASMSHELRTPMNAVLGFCQLLMRDRKEPLTERQREMVDQVYRGGEHLLHLVDDVLDLARIEANRLAIAPEPVSAATTIREVLEATAPAAQQAGVTLHFAQGGELPPIHADPRRLAQILMNFSSNAIKYNRPGGTVRWVIATSADQSRVRMSVIDTGRGIAVKHQHKLFEPFQRAGQEAGPIEGTGIGLAISKRLAALMGGSVGFESTPGEGSTFWVELPVSRAREATRSTPPPAEPRALAVARALVLYIEDNPASIQFMRDALASIDGIECIVSMSAEEGLVIARQRRPDLILMDINLPGMSGFDALHALASAPHTREIPVVAITAAASENDRARGKAAGFVRYLTKPLRIEELERALEELLPQRR